MLQFNTIYNLVEIHLGYGDEFSAFSDTSENTLFKGLKVR